MKIGIFYGSTTGTTENVAREIARQLGLADTDLHNVAQSTVAATAAYDLLILGSSTWGCGELQDDWYGFLEALQACDLSGKRVALFGCGDSESYPETFCDAVGVIYEALQGSGCTFLGSSDPAEYSSLHSLICNEGKLLGLAIDESSPARNAARIAAWCEQLGKALQ